MAKPTQPHRQTPSVTETDLLRTLGKAHGSAPNISFAAPAVSIHPHSRMDDDIQKSRHYIPSDQKSFNIKRTHSFQTINQGISGATLPSKPLRPVESSFQPPTYARGRPTESLTIYYMGRPMSARASVGYPQTTASEIGFVTGDPGPLSLVGQRWYPPKADSPEGRRAPYPINDFYPNYPTFQKEHREPRKHWGFSQSPTYEEELSVQIDHRPTALHRSASARVPYPLRMSPMHSNLQHSERRLEDQVPSANEPQSTWNHPKSVSEIGFTNGTQTRQQAGTLAFERKMPSECPTFLSVLPVRFYPSNANRAELILPAQKTKSSDSVNQTSDVKRDGLATEEIQKLREKQTPVNPENQESEKSGKREEFPSNITLKINPTQPLPAKPKEQCHLGELNEITQKKDDKQSKTAAPESLPNKKVVKQGIRRARSYSLDDTSEKSPTKQSSKPFKLREQKTAHLLASKESASTRPTRIPKLSIPTISVAQPPDRSPKKELELAATVEEASPSAGYSSTSAAQPTFEQSHTNLPHGIYTEQSEEPFSKEEPDLNKAQEGFLPHPVTVPATEATFSSPAPLQPPLKSILKRSTSVSQLSSLVSPLSITKPASKTFPGIKRTQSARTLVEKDNVQLKNPPSEKRVGFDIRSNSILEFYPYDSTDESGSFGSEE
ncbi:hypothetical protein T265_04285 [Opisthorchis viverrini]|uniref:Uncharacterized protein n=1 Tax=Opisthorchis viverrini TaxID=6198 RepID=A0A075AGR6_OPIVI|nr:hypothetical protein T265_04285 [Opisthorchis viverrini]KER28989.1 hypothetical protein T265_04285 [Opisthorchis viverrini]